MNIEYKTAMTQVRKALRDQGVGRLLWVMNRGFDDAKLPIGLQILAPAFAESKLLRVARMYEKETDWHTKEPGCE